MANSGPANADEVEAQAYSTELDITYGGREWTASLGAFSPKSTVVDSVDKKL